ncbi:hypothetical protein ACGLWX_04810 [Halomonas sp. HMF6819]|uniref:hypothetical protein n=1 Tax=Halomonas sp. HMF6819 TaxID=3373085 RepID=UPI0037935694
MTITYIQAAVAAFALVSATAAATWNIRNDRLEELNSIVNSYEAAKSWKVPETIAKLDESVEYLNSELGLIVENQQYKEEIDELMIQISELSETVSMKNSQISALEDKVAEQEQFFKEFFSDTEEFVLENNTSIGFFGAEIVVALNDAYETLGYADVTINNSKHRIEVGSIIPVTNANKTCDLIFKEFVGYNSIKLSILCQEI